MSVPANPSFPTRNTGWLPSTGSSRWSRTSSLVQRPGPGEILIHGIRFPGDADIGGQFDSASEGTVGIEGEVEPGALILEIVVERLLLADDLVRGIDAGHRTGRGRTFGLAASDTTRSEPDDHASRKQRGV